jgi:hypothetical protein
VTRAPITVAASAFRSRRVGDKLANFPRIKAHLRQIVP